MPTNESDGDQVERTAEHTNSAGSQETGDKQSSFDATKLQSTLEALAKKLDEVDKRSASLQGDKDRGVNKATAEVEALKKKIAELEKYRKAGYDDDAALEEISFRESVREVKNQIAELKAVSAGNGAVDVAKVVSDHGLDVKDPEVIVEILSKKWDNPDLAELAVRRFKDKQAAKPEPSDADALSKEGTSGRRMADSEINAIHNKILTLSKSYTQNKVEIEKLAVQLRTEANKQ